MGQLDLLRRRRTSEAIASVTTLDTALDTRFDSLETIRARARAVAEHTHGIAQRGELARASTAWMAATFALCYLAIPTALSAVGLRPWAVGGPLEMPANLLGDLGGFACMLLMTLVGIAVFRPHVDVTQAQRDPVVSAAAGSLLTWAALHNVLPWLIPFADMGTAPLAAFLAANVLECALFGLMLGSFVRSPVKAFVLGSAFQAAFLTVASMATMFAWNAGF